MTLSISTSGSATPKSLRLALLPVTRPSFVIHSTTGVPWRMNAVCSTSMITAITV